MVSKDPDSSEFFFPIIMLFLAILAFLNFISLSLDKDFSTDEANIRETANDSSLNLSPETIVLNNKFKEQQKNSLRFKYLLCYLLVKGSVWSKAPYMFMLYLNFHMFKIEQIGVLYVIDYLSSLLFSPIIGGLTDMYGRKRFSILYNILVIINILLRITGSQWLAYLAQVLTGIGSSIINTAYESWVVCESKKIFSDNVIRQKFLKKLFKK